MQDEQDYELDYYDNEEDFATKQNESPRPNSNKAELPNEIDHPIKRKVFKSINLSNFDPFDRSIKINSPRSLEVCFSNGIDPLSLYHKSYKEIKNSVNPLRRNDEKYIRLMYIQSENKRSEAVLRLTKIREQRIQGPDTSLNTTPLSRCDYFKQIKERYSINLVKDDFKFLDPEIVKKENFRASSTITKELKNMIGMIQKDFGIGQRYNLKMENNRVLTGNISMRNSIRNDDLRSTRHKKLVEDILKKREERIYKRINKEKLTIERWKSNRRNERRNMRMIIDFERERSDERKKLLQSKEKYRQNVLLQRIHYKDNKSLEFQQTKTEILKLRQKLRKDSTYKKYRAKLDLEKAARRFNDSEEISETKVIKQMLEVTGLDELYEKKP